MAYSFNFDRDMLSHVDDERVQKLLSGVMSQEDFIKSTVLEDPWVFVDNNMKLLSEQQINSNVESYIRFRKGTIIATGGVTPDTLVANRDLVCEVYPEITEAFERTDAEIAAEPNCKECVKNFKYGKVLEQLLKMKYDGRDLSKLSVFGPLAVAKLKGQSIDLEDIVVDVPPGIKKTPFKMKSETAIKSAPQEGFDRPACKLCVLKHLAYAFECLKEVAQGYTPESGHDHLAIAIASLEHAEHEALAGDPTFAEKIRNFRNRLTSKVSWK